MINFTGGYFVTIELDLLLCKAMSLEKLLELWVLLETLEDVTCQKKMPGIYLVKYSLFNFGIELYAQNPFERGIAFKELQRSIQYAIEQRKLFFTIQYDPERPEGKYFGEIYTRKENGNFQFFNSRNNEVAIALLDSYTQYLQSDFVYRES